MEKSEIEQAEEDREKIVDKFFEFLRYIFIGGLDNPTEADAEFAKTLIDNVRRHVVQAMEVGQDEGYNPIGSLTIWLKQTGIDNLDFTYRIDSIGGEVYERYNLSSLTQRLDAAIGEWGKETFGAEKAEKDFIQSWGHLKKPTVH